jgi:hypothetical protein
MLSAGISGFGRRIGWLAALLPLMACAGKTDNARADAKEVPEASAALFTVDLWPGEGVPVIVARRTTLLLRAAPDPGSTVVDTLASSIGSRLIFDSTRTQTIEPGVIRVLTGIRLTGRDLGNETHLGHDEYYDRARQEVDLHVVAPAAIEYLQDRAEGTCFVRMDQRVIDANPCPAFVTDSVRVERAPITRWWIRLSGQGGASGWLLVSDSTAQSIRREF